MHSTSVQRAAFRHKPFQSSTKLQPSRSADRRRTLPRFEAVHRRHVAIHLASRDLNLDNSLDVHEADTVAVPSGTAFNRRSVAAAALALGVLTPFSTLAGKAAALQQNGVIEYVNNKQGYRIERPSTWEQTSKAGADVLFTDPLRKSTTIGVTVNPIKIAGLEQFGDVKTVREKLVNTEKQKESTKDISLISESSRRGKSGTLIYDIEYELDSTRGRKRILSTVGIAQKKLFIVNGNIKCDASGCNEGSSEIATLRQVASTFDVV